MQIGAKKRGWIFLDDHRFARLARKHRIYFGRDIVELTGAQPRHFHRPKAGVAHVGFIGDRGEDHRHAPPRAIQQQPRCRQRIGKITARKPGGATGERATEIDHNDRAPLA
jgi:hypothetical protein